MLSQNHRQFCSKSTVRQCWKKNTVRQFCNETWQINLGIRKWSATSEQNNETTKRRSCIRTHEDGDRTNLISKCVQAITQCRVTLCYNKQNERRHCLNKHRKAIIKGRRKILLDYSVWQGCSTMYKMKKDRGIINVRKPTNPLFMKIGHNQYKWI